MSEKPDWDHIRAIALSNAKPPADWPNGVKPISLEGLALIGLDREHTLYWDGKLVRVERRFDLSFWQKVGAFLTVASAVSVALVAVVGFAIKIF